MKKLSFLTFLLISFTSLSQISFDTRKEIDVKESAVSKVIPVGSNGVVTYGIRNEKGPDIIEITQYNSDLEVEKETELTNEFRGYSLNTLKTEDNNHIFFLKYFKSKLNVIHYNTESNNAKESVFSVPDKFIPSTGVLVDGKFVFSGRVGKKPAILFMDPYSGEGNVVLLPGKSKKRTIESFTPDNIDENLVVFYLDYEGKQRIMNMVVYSSTGQEKSQIILDNDPKYGIVDGEITWINDDDFILAGTYSLSRGSTANGIYFSKWEGGKQQFITYHSFTDFENFLSYLPKKQQAKIEKKMKRKQNRGKEDVLRCYVAVHPVKMMGENYFFLGEVYYPTYRTETYTTFVNGVATTQTRQVFDGYQYSHAVAMGVDESGNRLYDHCFEMYLSHKPFSVVKNIRMTIQGEEARLLFSTGSSLKACFIVGDKIESKDYGSLIPEDENEKVKWTGFTNAVYWYENFYIIHGTQKIKNDEKERGERRRVVFFMQKISYQE